MKRAAEVLDGAQIEVTLIRGLSLALGPYTELGLRMVDSAQVVVGPGNLARSIDRLTDQGFAVDGRVGLPGFGLPTRLTQRGGGRIDIHEFVFGPGWPATLDPGIWQRRHLLQLDGEPVRTLAPCDAVAAAAAFGLSIPLSRHQSLVDLAMLERQKDPAVKWTDVIDYYQDTLLSVPISEAFGIIAEVMPGAITAETLSLVREIRPTRRQHIQFWFHRRGRRLARLLAWYWRAHRLAGSDKRVGFIRFAKGVYNVDTIRDALAKALRRIGAAKTGNPHSRQGSAATGRPGKRPDTE